MKNNLRKSLKSGFTLIELLIVVAIIGILATLLTVVLGTARNKGNDAGIQENLRNANAQAEIFWNTNTAVPNSYTNVCENVAQVGGVNTISLFMLNAANDSGLSDYTVDGTGTLTTATCNDSADAWAAEVPLRSISGMWCVDESGKSKVESTSIGTGTACN